MVNWFRSCLPTIRRVAGTLFGPKGFQGWEILIVVGLALVAAGFWYVPELGIRSGALFAPGAIVLWISLPTRAAILERPVHQRKQKSEG